MIVFDEIEMTDQELLYACNQLELEIKAVSEQYPAVKIERLPGEVWEDVPGYENQYGVSNMGRVWRVAKVVTLYDQVEIPIMGNLLQPYLTPGGHLKVSLYAKGQEKKMYVHRLVAAAFLGDIPEGYDIHHKDRNKKNNRLDNLEPIERSAHSRMHNLGENAPGAILTEEKVKRVRKLIKQGLPDKEIGKEFGVHPNTISNIRHGRNWAQVSDQWRMQQSPGMRHPASHQFKIPTRNRGNYQNGRN